MNLKEFLEQKAPWLVKNFNGVEWETKQAEHERRIRAMEASIQTLWRVCNDLNNDLNDHTQGRKHKPQPERIPAPDEE